MLKYGFTFFFLIGLTTIVFGKDYEITSNFISYKTNTIHFELTKNENNQIYINQLNVPGETGLIRSLMNSHTTEIVPIWIIDLLEPNQKIYASSAKFRGWTVQESLLVDQIILNWQFIKDKLNLIVKIKINIPKYSSSTLWQMEIVSLNDSPFTPQRIVFPILSHFPNPDVINEKIRLVNPRLWGEMYYSANAQEITSVYPSASLQMQFWSLFTEKSEDALYIAARDTEGYYKLFKNGFDSNDKSRMRIEHWYFPEPTPNLTWASPYPIEIRPYKGDWYKAAKFYRNWITNTKMVIPNKQKSEKWVMNNDFWLRGGPKSDPKNTFTNDSKLIPLIKSVTEQLGVNTALHLYNWHHYKFDYKYPEYFPPRDGFEDFIKLMKQAGIHVVPYINGRIADDTVIQSDLELKNSVALASLSNSENLNAETWKGHKFSVMCPSSSGWHSKLLDISSILLKKYNTDGIYFDQVCNSKAVKCVNITHGHFADKHKISSNSSGNHWVRGYQNIFDDVKNIAKNNTAKPVFISEDAAEAWNNFFDIFLMYNSRSTDFANTYEIVPLYPTVFSGYTLTMGFQDLSVETDKHLSNHLSFLARSFVWGAQLGWLTTDQLLSNSILFDYSKKLAKARSKVRNYLHYGEMKEQPVVIVSEPNLLINEWKVINNERKYFSYQIDPIQSSYWELNPDSAVVLVTNFTAKPFVETPVKITVQLNEFSFRNGKYRVQFGNGESYVAELNSSKFTIEIPLAAYSVRYVELVKI